jgi:flagellar basal-body rod modification protein FlgD
MAIDAAAINAASQNANASSGSSISDRQASSKASLADSEQTFLTLMTTQLKNQDPLSPVDSTQFTQQIVQMTGVEQQLLTNDLLSALVGMNDGGLTQSVNLIGKDVATQSDTGVLKDGKVSFDFNLPTAASTLKLEVRNAAGDTVATIDPSKLTDKGDHSVTWDGKLAAGGTADDGGLYTLKITAEDSGGNLIKSAATSTTTGKVTAVSQENGVTMVTIDGRKVKSTDIISVAEAAAPADTTTAASNTDTTSDPDNSSTNDTAAAA